MTRADLARLLPELNQSVSERFGGVEEERRAQFEAIEQALDSFARAGPFALIVEDLHWADKASLDLMQHMLGSVASSRFIVVCSCRVEELPGPGWYQDPTSKIHFVGGMGRSGPTTRTTSASPHQCRQ